ncbi:MAG: hypothetical protein ACE5ID_06825 [Acidobacteriota bacterium]
MRLRNIRILVAILFLVGFILWKYQSNHAVASEPMGHLVATGEGPVFQILPAPAVFRQQVPARMQSHLPPDPTPFGNRVKRITGIIHVEATDQTQDLLPDPPYTSDSASVEAEFVTEDGAKWKVIQTRVAPRLKDGTPKLFAGVGMDEIVHGDTGKENPFMPKMKAALTMWGFADVYKDGEIVKTDALLHIMVTSRARSLKDGRYGDYDVTDQPIEEIHLFLNPANKLPAPGGFLHVNWERSTVNDGRTSGQPTD